ncbi:MAG: dihydropteroate synthase [Leptolyngbyaceae cyanobacterium CSU_1_3]|nr:dihydropteroate synthase [Leptolyngbyaceae cyanobacterium CSU_1_3]
MTDPPPSPPIAWVLRDRPFIWGQQTYLMGVLNVTPDSFSDGGQFNTLETALTQAQQMVRNGADLLDIGGQSTRPNATEVTLEVELDRVIPIIQALRQDATFATVPISVDTTQAEVAKAAIAAGADFVNDISGGTFDADMLSEVAKLGVPIVLMHLRGNPRTMQQMTDYQDLMGEIYHRLQHQITAAIAAGIDRTQIMIDPGIGFAKKPAQSLEILRKLPVLHRLNCPILVGASRKSFIGHILDQPDPKQRVWGTAAACTIAIIGGAHMLRVHDVAEMRDVCRVADAIWRG